MRRLVIPLLIMGLAACNSGEKDITTLAAGARDGNSRAARTLVKAMGSSEAGVGLEAYKAVVSLGRKVEPYLRSGLRSSNGEVREACAAALGSLGSPENILLLIQALNESRRVPYAVVWALGEIGDPSAAPALATVLAGPNDVLRKAAVRSLIKIGSRAGDEVLSLLMDSPDAPTQRAAVRVAGEIRLSEAVPLLTGVAGRNRDAAVWALGRIGDPAALGSLIEALGDRRWKVRREAAEALGRLEDIRAAPELEKFLDDQEPVVREWAARSLETLTGRRVLYRDENGEMIPPYNLYR